VRVAHAEERLDLAEPTERQDVFGEARVRYVLKLNLDLPLGARSEPLSLQLSRSELVEHVRIGTAANSAIARISRDCRVAWDAGIPFVPEVPEMPVDDHVVV
jgi:hypothetical protein